MYSISIEVKNENNVTTEIIEFPVAPGSISTKIANKNYNYDLINGEELTVITKPGLTEIGFDLLLPNTMYPFARYDDNKFIPASTYLEKLYQIKNNLKDITLNIQRITDTNPNPFNTSMDVTLEDLEIREDTEEGNDVIVSLNFKEYISDVIKYITVVQPAKNVLLNYAIFKEEKKESEDQAEAQAKAEAQAGKETTETPKATETPISKTFLPNGSTVDNKALETEQRKVKSKIPNIKNAVQNITKNIYNSKEFDSLTKIAKEVYGDAKEWTAIYEENKTIIDSYASKLKLSKYIVVPDLPLKIPNIPVGVKKWLTN